MVIPVYTSVSAADTWLGSVIRIILSAAWNSSGKGLPDIADT
jgi:hypothetical protein